MLCKSDAKWETPIFRLRWFIMSGAASAAHFAVGLQTVNTDVALESALSIVCANLWR